MISLEIKGLRSLVNTNSIDLKPITIAVGKNSSGKSTLLRFFPLIKQTLETKISEPILWFGRHVDFGDFNQCISYNKKVMEFHFYFEINSNIYNDYFHENSQRKKVLLIINLNENDLLSALFKFDNKTITINFDGNNIISNIIINDFPMNKYGSPLYNYIKTDGKLLPELKTDESSLQIDGKSILYFNSFNYYEHNPIVISFIKKAIEDYDLGNNLESFLLDNFHSFMIAKINNGNEQNYKNRLSPYNYEKKLNKKVNNIIRKFNLYLDEHFEEALIIFDYSYLPLLVKECNDYLTQYFNSVSYIAPIRATAERYYRKQGLNVEDVDARGDNVPMIIQNMKAYEKNEFNKWLFKNFDFKISTKSSFGHISIFVEKDSKKFNITDTGFGYSQILPIILLIWKNLNTISSKIKKQIIIEQPELHLHPKMQSQLIDIILKTISQNENIQFLIETHSECIINHIGRKIEAGNVSNDKINILLFDQEDSGFSTIKQINYTPQGYLERWPIDFFQDGDVNW